MKKSIKKQKIIESDKALFQMKIAMLKSKNERINIAKEKNILRGIFKEFKIGKKILNSNSSVNYNIKVNLLNL